MNIRLLLLLLTPCLAPLTAGEWRFRAEAERQQITPELSFAKRTAVRASDGMEATVLLAFFTSKSFRLEVIDQGTEANPALGSFSQALRDSGCVAGVNGGFFHPDYRPLGLMITDGKRTGQLETSKLLSGVVYSDADGIHILRRAQFTDHPGITALLQTGPFLVEAGSVVRGLSPADPRRRTFIATDWRGHWVVGATLSSLTLADLGECLASGGCLTGWRIDRAINLDGGSSTGFYFDRGAGNAPATLIPWKRVRNLLGIMPR
jgi:hypothetical protein